MKGVFGKSKSSPQVSKQVINMLVFPMSAMHQKTGSRRLYTKQIHDEPQGSKVSVLVPLDIR